MLSSFKATVNQNRHILLLIILLSLFLPSNYNSYTIIALVLQWVFLVPREEKKHYFKFNFAYLVPFLGYFFLFAISILYSENTSSGLKDLESKLSLLIFPLVILCQKPLSQKERTRFFSYYSVSVMTIGLVAVAISIIQFNTLLVNQELSALVNMHASYTSLYLAVGFFYSFHKLIVKKENSLINLLIISVISVLLILFAARIVLLSVFVAILVWFVFVVFNIKRVLILISTSVLLFFAGYNIDGVKSRIDEAISTERVDFEKPLKENCEVKLYGGRAIRLAIWKCASDVLDENWIFGVGSGDVHHHLQKSYKDHNFLLAWKYNNYNSHNLYLETLIAVGALGLSMLLMLFIHLFSKGIAYNDFFCFSFGLLFFLFSMMEASFNVQRGIVFLLLMSTVFLSRNYHLE